MPAIRIDGVTKAYKNGPRAVDDVSLEVRDGEFMVLVGPSGCGKSTLLKMIAGHRGDDRGHDPHRRARRHPARPAQARHRDGLPELRALPAPVACAATSASGSSCARRPRREIAARVDEVARDPRPRGDARAQAGRAVRRPAPARGDGPRDRARAAAFLMDEPLSNLDAKLRVSMRAQLSRLHERLGVTTVYVTHDQVEAMTLGQRVAVLRGGVLQQCDTPEVLFERPGEPVRRRVHRLAGDEPRRGDRRGRRGALRRLPRRRSRPARRCAAGIVLGMRPHDLKLGGRRPASPAASQVVERLGTETHVVVGIDAPRLRADALARRARRRARTTTSCWPTTTARRSRS